MAPRHAEDILYIGVCNVVIVYYEKELHFMKHDFITVPAILTFYEWINQGGE